MTEMTHAYDWSGRTVVDGDGEKIGKIDELYLDRHSDKPEWARVHTGLLGTKRSFVPLAGARPQGEDVQVPVSKDQVKDAPNVDPDGELSPEEERRLYQHYGRSDYEEWTSDSEDRTEATFGRDTSGRTTDEAMTRSEEELAVGTQRRETGRARLRKYVETENVQQTVPVRREEVRVEREPITDANVDDAVDGPEISEEEHEVVLREEEPVAEKRTVPKERVRLDKDTHTEERQVSDTVRREEIDVDDSAERRQ